MKLANRYSLLTKDDSGKVVQMIFLDEHSVSAKTLEVADSLTGSNSVQVIVAADVFLPPEQPIHRHQDAVLHDSFTGHLSPCNVYRSN